MVFHLTAIGTEKDVYPAQHRLGYVVLSMVTEAFSKLHGKVHSEILSY